MSIALASVLNDIVADEKIIHFNNAGASLMPKAVLDSQINHLQLEAQLGGYEAANAKQVAIDGVYNSVAKLINAHSDEIALVENATLGWLSAFKSIEFNAGDKILTAQCEYGSNYLAYLQLQKEKKIEIIVIPSNADGEVCTQALAALIEQDIDNKIKLISITHIPTNGGLVNPIEKIGAIARQHKILYLVDACQSVGQLPIDVSKIQCDFLTATARKYLRGPRGAGFLYVRQQIMEQLTPPFIDVRSATWTSPTHYKLRSDAKRFENWENNYAALLGMGCAIDYAQDIGLAEIETRNTELASYFREQLNALQQVTVQDIGRKKCAIVTFSIAGIDANTIKKSLSEDQIHVSCSSPSSTLIDATIRQLPDVVRASVHYFNTLSQIDTFITSLTALITTLSTRESHS